MKIIELLENIGKGINILSDSLSNLQSKFMESTLYKVVNTSIDCGIRILLPNFIEDEVIDLKNSIMENGLVKGIKEAVNSAIQFGKNIYGITTGKFNSVEQMQNIIDKSGTINTISSFLDEAIDTIKSMGIINSNVKTVLKSGKNAFLNNIKNNISDEFNNQKKYLNQVEKYAKQWNDAYIARDLEEMKDIFYQLESYIEKTIPLKETMKIYNEIKIIQEMIENNKEKFDLSQNEIELIEAFSN